MKKLLGIVLVVFAFPAFAADVNYNYAEIGYQKIDIDDNFIDVDGDGFGIGGSFELGENWFLAASYASADFDFGIDLDQISVGVGYHVDISDNTSFYGKLMAVRAEASGFGESADEDGFGVEIGLRGMVTDNVELGGSLGYVDLGDAGDGTSVGAHLLYNFNESFAVGIFIDVEEDVNSYGGGFRLYW